MNSVSIFLSGAVSMGFGVAGAFFFHFWKRTRDRLFAIFGIAFLIMSVEHIILLGVGGGRLEEEHALVYLCRLAAFVMILLGIIDKNRR